MANSVVFPPAPLGFSWPFPLPPRNNTLSHPLFASCARVGRLVGRPRLRIHDRYVFSRTNVIPCARVRCIHRKSYDVLPATGSSRFPSWLPRQRLKNRKRAGGGTGEWRKRNRRVWRRGGRREWTNFFHLEEILPKKNISSNFRKGFRFCEICARIILRENIYLIIFKRISKFSFNTCILVNRKSFINRIGRGWSWRG